MPVRSDNLVFELADGRPLRPGLFSDVDRSLPQEVETHALQLRNGGDSTFFEARIWVESLTAGILLAVDGIAFHQADSPDMALILGDLEVGAARTFWVRRELSIDVGIQRVRLRVYGLTET